MIKHPAVRKALAALCGLCAFFCMTASVLYSCVLNRNTMYSGFLLYARTEAFNVKADRYSEYADAIVNCLSGKTDTVQVKNADGVPQDAFSEKENAHMRDVRGLIRLLSWLRIGSGALALLFAAALWLTKGSTGEGVQSVLWFALGAWVWLVLLSVLIALALSGFDSFFVGFHRLFFHNDLWLLNPNTDLLIALMPTPFFVWYGGQVLSKLWVVAALGIALLVAALYLVRLEKKEAKAS